MKKKDLGMSGLTGISDLLAAAQGGDKQAENELFSKLRARILSLVQQRIWNTKRAQFEIVQEAENITHDVCTAIFHRYKTERFSTGDKFLAWVFQIVRHKVGDYYRVHQKDHLYERINLEQNNQPGPSEPSWPDENIDHEELIQLIHRALKKMKACCREIIEALLAGEIKAYIARQSKKTPINTIYCWIHRCRQELSDFLNKEGYELWNV